MSKGPLVMNTIAATASTTSTVLPTPAELSARLPLDEVARYRVQRARQEIRAILDGVDTRLLVIVGPCSIHDPKQGLEYARNLARLAQQHRDHLLIVMRSYFEKPRTTVGWKGLINDPALDGSHDMARGLQVARSFLRDVAELGLPTATEFLEPLTAQYFSDLISWGAIGARTTESQVHRQLVAELPMPVGFKNGTDGGIQVAIDACQASAAAQSFVGVDEHGRISQRSTEGNPATHLILRGGASGPNYSRPQIEQASAAMRAAGANGRVIVDASHANSGKDHVRQAEVLEELAAEIASGEAPIAGVMAESFLEAGAQKFTPGVDEPSALVPGVSITDACMGFEATERALAQLAQAVSLGQQRREAGLSLGA
ncbi:3-deoxy-7-phosphoheptulonate synthase [Glutamicibacter sp. PS]|uniref:3-deoxy-7-phosphoheptulonate synthase n=1 Tax=Glutamicibacter sp. PS TaxID=3075634 RepID=UPI0037C00C5F